MGYVRAALCVLFLLFAAPAIARPYGVDDLLRGEGFGSMLISRDGRWLVFERLIPFEDAAAFHFNAMEVLRSRLYRVDLRHPGPAQPLVPIAPGAATAAYGFSPDGRYFALGRLDGPTWRLGVVTMATGEVRWFDLAPDYNSFRPTLAWVGGDRLVAIVAPDKALPWMLDLDSKASRLLPGLWQTQRSGTAPTVTAIGSGGQLAVTPRRPPSALVLLDVASGATRTLARGEYGALSVSADGRYVATLEDADPIPAQADQPMDGGADLHRRRLRVIAIASGRIWSPCPACDLTIAPPRWSPSGDRLVFFARAAGQAWRQGAVRVADADRQTLYRSELAALAPVIEGFPIVYASVPLSWLGGDPLLYARRAGGEGRADWYRLGRGHPVARTAMLAHTSAHLMRTGAGALMMIDQNNAWRIGRRAARPVIAGADDIVIVNAADADQQRAHEGAQVIATRSIGGVTRIAIAGQHRGAGSGIAIAGAGEIVPVGIGGAGDSVVATDRAVGGIEHLLVQGRSGQPIVVATINQGLEDVDVARPMALHYRLASGAPATGWLYLPENAGATKLPLITMPYGGHVYDERPPSPDGRGLDGGTGDVSVLVGHGYAVLLPSMPPIDAPEQGALDFAGQILPAVDAAIATGLVDPRRLGLWGHSFGAYDAAMTVAHTDRFAAALVANGIYDIASGVGTFTPWTRLDPGNGQSILAMAGWAETGQARLRATPWSNPARYVENSALYHADRIVTPLLIVAADEDVAALGQSEMLFSALYRQNKDAELLSYWGENHVLVSPANIRDFYARAFAWFDGHFARALTPARQAARASPMCPVGSDRATHAPSARPAAPAADRHSDRCA